MTPHGRPPIAMVPAPLAAVVLGVVAALYSVSPARLTARCRAGYLPEARSIVMKLLWERGYGATAVGHVLSLHHSTVLHHVHRMEAGVSAEVADSLQTARQSVTAARRHERSTAR